MELISGRNLHLRIICLVSLLLCLLWGAATASAQSTDDARSDTQLWPDVSLAIRLREKVRLNLQTTVREGRDITTAVNEQFGIGLAVSLNKYITVAHMYRLIRSHPFPGSRQLESRWGTDLTIRVPLRGGFVVSDRNRHEFRNIAGTWSQRYRNRMQVERSFSILDRRITPYISAEPYYDTRFHEWARTQYFVGARVPIIKHLTLDGFYMRQLDDRSRPGNLHVIGTFIRLDF